MLDPHQLPEDLRALERDLLQSSRNAISNQLRDRIMNEVRTAMRREQPRKSRRPRTVVLVCGLTCAACIVLAVFRQTNRNPEPAPPNAGRLMVSSNEAIPSVPIPTLLAYRLSHDIAADDWEQLLERRADAFAVADQTQAHAIAWNDRSSMLESKD